VATTTDYVTLAEAKSTFSLGTASFADADIQAAISAASRAVDDMCSRRFWLDADASQVRFYTPTALRYLPIDDLVVLTSVAIDRSGTGTFSETWTVDTTSSWSRSTHPTTSRRSRSRTCRVRALSGRWLPTYIEKSVRVTGQFGWQAVPPQIHDATLMLTGRLFKRKREAPFGVVGLGLDSAAVRIMWKDPDVHALICDWRRGPPLI
jgi:hypothetical protein